MLSNVTEKDIVMALISMGIAEEEETPVPTETPEEAKNVTEVFSDVHTDWYTDYVQYVYDNGLMTGIKRTDRFELNANITKISVERFCRDSVKNNYFKRKVFGFSSFFENI